MKKWIDNEQLTSSSPKAHSTETGGGIILVMDITFTYKAHYKSFRLTLIVSLPTDNFRHF